MIVYVLCLNKLLYQSYYTQHDVRNDFLIFKVVEGNGCKTIPIQVWTRS